MRVFWPGEFPAEKLQKGVLLPFNDKQKERSMCWFAGCWKVGVARDEGCGGKPSISAEINNPSSNSSTFAWTYNTHLTF